MITSLNPIIYLPERESNPRETGEKYEKPLRGLVAYEAA
nr:MetaGeneMark_Unknown Function [uncultured bacterium]